ncbi:hypothetical protein ACHAWF_009189 [Thalassiosira exigua]
MSRSGYYRNQHAGDGSWSDFVGDVYSGVAVGIGHPKWFVEKTIGQGWRAVASLGNLVGVGSTDDSNDSTGSVESRPLVNGSEDRGALSASAATDGGASERGLKVVGVGYGRTGTYSLALALDELGFPTLHTQHLYENPEIFDHLVTNVFHMSIREGEIIMGEPDFDLLPKGGFTATMDLPFALYFDQIRERYPDCKFVLTVRENSEVWFRSWDVLTRSISKPAQYTSFIFAHVKKLEHYMRWLFSVVNRDEKFLSSPFPLPPQDKVRAIESYERHNQRVRESIPSSQLLEYNVRQGWEPLCEFLEIPEAECPSAQGVAFPRSNSARAVRWQSYSAFIGPMILTLFIIFSLFSLVFHKITGMSVVGWCCVQKSKFLHFASNTLEKRRRKRHMVKMD